MPEPDAAGARGGGGGILHRQTLRLVSRPLRARFPECRAFFAQGFCRYHPRLVNGAPPQRPLTPAAEVWINPPENRPTVRTLELPGDTKFVPQLSQSH